MYEESQQHWYDKVIYFFIVHQVMIKRMFIFLFTFICIIIWVLAIIGWINYLTSIKKYSYDISLIKNDLIDYETYKAVHGPKNIQNLLTSVIVKEGTKYDFLAKVKNPNSDWAAEKVIYKFSYSGGATESRTDYIMPGKEKYLFIFSEDIKLNISQANLIIEEVSWRKIKNNDNLKILPNITAENEFFKQEGKSSIVGFSVKNLTPYDFWSVGWQIVLYQDSNPIAVNYLTVNNLLSLSEKQVQVVWFNNLPTPSKIDIIADIDVLSDSVFMKKDYGPGQPKGFNFEY